MNLFKRNKKDNISEKADLDVKSDFLGSKDENIAKLANSLYKSVSYKETFIRGLINGIAAAIGATLVAGILLGLLSTVIDRADNIPIIDDIIEKSGLKDILDKTND